MFINRFFFNTYYFEVIDYKEKTLFLTGHGHCAQIVDNIIIGVDITSHLSIFFLSG